SKRDWSSDVCSSDLAHEIGCKAPPVSGDLVQALFFQLHWIGSSRGQMVAFFCRIPWYFVSSFIQSRCQIASTPVEFTEPLVYLRSEEHTSELQSRFD